MFSSCSVLIGGGVVAAVVVVLVVVVEVRLIKWSAALMVVI